MALRIARYLSARQIGEDEGKCLVICPIYSNEQARHVSFRAVAMTTARTAAHRLGEINWYGMYIPFAVLMTYLDSGTGATGSPIPMGTADWDLRLRELLLTKGDAGDQYYGGDYTAGDKEEAVSEQSSSNQPRIGGALMGPTGVSRWLSRETLLVPWGSDGPNQTRKWDTFGGSQDIGYGPGVLVFYVQRYEIDTQTDFEFCWPTDDSGLRENATSILIGGDISRVNDMIKRDTGDAADWMRTTLFGGDNYIEASSLNADAAMATVKMAITIETPYMVLDK